MLKTGIMLIRILFHHSDYRYLKHFLPILILTICLISCNGHSKHWETLSQIESYIEEKPDSALVTLKQIDLLELSNKDEKAKYALLYAMALDKNFVDKTDFEILQPAIDYYEDNGSATDKLRTYYYQGRIYQNQGNDAMAMKSFVNALDIGCKSNDNLTKARVLVAQSNLYYSLMEWDKVCSVNIEAADYYYELGRTNNYVYCLLRCVGGYIQCNNYDKAKALLDKCYLYTEHLPESLISEIYSYHLLYSVAVNDFDSVPIIIGEYTNKVSEDNIDYLTIVGAYTDIGAYNKAEDLLIKIEAESFNDNNQILKYYTTLIRIYEHKGDYRKAYELYLKFNELNDSILFSIFESDTQFIEEKYALEVQNMEERVSKNKLILLTIILGVIFIAITIYIRGRLKYRTIQQRHAEQEAERYRLMYEQMEEERDNLTNLLAQNDELEPDVKTAVGKRLELLNKFFTAYITNNIEIDRKANKEMEELLANKDTFMVSTKLAFAGSHPKFIKYLEERGLTEWEINYCCLYALGLKGKEVGTYIRMRSHYNNSSEVREKLGINEHETNLGIYIRKLLKSFE